MLFINRIKNLIYGDITSIDIESLPTSGIDMITHGSPCQDFSVAGLQAGGDIGSGTRSSLMWNSVAIINHVRPKYVVWENVKNALSKKHIHNFEKYLKSLEDMGYKNYYKILNAKDYGIPQNRERVYCISIRNDINFSFPEKEKLEKMPIDYIEENVDEKYYLTDTNLKCYQREFGSKGKEIDLFEPIPTLTASMGTGGGNTPYFVFPPKEELKLKLKDMLEDNVDEKFYLDEDRVAKIQNSSFIQEKKRIQEKDYCDTLLARDWKDPKCVPVEHYSFVEKKYENFINKNGYVPEMFNPYNQAEIKDIAPTQSTQCGSTTSSATVLKVDNQNLDNQEQTNRLKIRKLTPRECWRLMGFSDEDFDRAQATGMSNSQLYKQAGNSIVVTVLEKIFRNLFNL